MIFILKLYNNFMYIYVQFLIQFILNFIHFIITKYCSFLLYFNIYSIMYGYLFCIISQNKNFYYKPGFLLKKFTQENKIRPLFGISKSTSILVKFNFFINIRKKSFWLERNMISIRIKSILLTVSTWLQKKNSKWMGSCKLYLFDVAHFAVICRWYIYILPFYLHCSYIHVYKTDKLIEMFHVNKKCLRYLCVYLFKSVNTRHTNSYNVYVTHIQKM